jgi:hypothetical protein
VSSVVSITLTEFDFERLHSSSMKWGKEWLKQKGRFSDAPLFTWKMAYWCDRYLDALFCQRYLSSAGCESQTVWDHATSQWVILTNYISEDWR